LFEPFDAESDHFTKTGSGQTQGKLTRRPFPAVFDDGDRLEVKGASWTFNGSETSLPRRCTVLKTEDLPRQARDRHRKS
jgi:hypothetical protein